VVRFATLRDESLDAVLVHLMMLHSLLDRNPLRESLVAKSFLNKYMQRNPVWFLFVRCCRVSDSVFGTLFLT
jgi:hypothetical protein